VLLTILVIFILILTNALFVAAEFASVSVPKVRIEQLADEGNVLARLVHANIKNSSVLRRYVGACQIGITASSLVLGVVGQVGISNELTAPLKMAGLTDSTAGALATAITLIILTVLQVVLGELVPKSLAMRYPDKVAMWLSQLLTVSLRVFSVPISILDFTARTILKLLRIPLHGERHVHSPEEIELLIIQGHKKGEFEDEEHRRLVRVLRFGERRVREAMVPRTRMHTLPHGASADDIVSLMSTSPYMRIPVYEGSLDHILGIIHVKDVAIALATGQDIQADKLVRHIPVVPLGLKCDDALEAMRRERAQMAIVLDEYGGTAGLVTMEDLFEEVMGDYQDEFDREVPRLKNVAAGEWLVRGDLSIEQLGEEIAHPLEEEEEVETVGGLVWTLLGRAPQAGDQVESQGLSFQVVETRRRNVHLVRVRLLSSPPPSGEVSGQ